MNVLRRGAVVITVAAVVAGLGIGGSGSATADIEVAYEAVADATGVNFTLTNPTIPAGIVIEGSGPTAQARLSSLGTSNAFSALPYPGETAANITGVVTALTGVPLPDYPLYVHSENGNESAPANFPGATLAAETSGYRSAARATALSDSVGYFADSVVKEDKDGSVSVKAIAQMNAFDVGGRVTLSGVVSKSTALMDSSGKVTLSSTMAIGRFVAPALRYTVPAQFCIPTQACQSIPAPFGGLVLDAPDIGFADGVFYLHLPVAGRQSFPVPAQSVLDAFEAIGVEMTYQAARKTKTSIVAPNFSFRTVLPSPPDNPAFNGPTPVSYTIGTTSASLVGQVTDLGPDLGFFPTVPEPGTGGLPAFPGATDAPPLASDGGVPVGLPVTEPDLGGPAATPELPTSGNPGQVVFAANREPLRGSVAWFYFVLIGVALVGTAAGQVLRYVGVRA
jgi:hypothetical protein